MPPHLVVFQEFSREGNWILKSFHSIISQCWHPTETRWFFSSSFAVEHFSLCISCSSKCPSPPTGNLTQAATCVVWFCPPWMESCSEESKQDGLMKSALLQFTWGPKSLKTEMNRPFRVLPVWHWGDLEEPFQHLGFLLSIWNHTEIMPFDPMGDVSSRRSSLRAAALWPPPMRRGKPKICAHPSCLTGSPEVCAQKDPGNQCGSRCEKGWQGPLNG